jgi:hypothetical protein
MQGNQIGQKIMGLAPDDMARLPHLINPKKCFVNVLVRQLEKSGKNCFSKNCLYSIPNP